MHLLNRLPNNNGFIQTAEALKHGIQARTLYQLRDEGVLEQLSYGLYRLAELPALTYPEETIVALRAPHAVICLISALHFHGLGTQLPYHIDIAVQRTQSIPKIHDIPIQVYRFSGAAYEEGIEHHTIDGVTLNVYCKEKTLADCFKYRNKIGLDVCLEALKDYMFTSQIKPQISKLTHYARICRVSNVMLPYLEALVA